MVKNRLTVLYLRHEGFNENMNNYPTGPSTAFDNSQLMGGPKQTSRNTPKPAKGPSDWRDGDMPPNDEWMDSLFHSLHARVCRLEAKMK
jgi:hypothetical protein